MKCSIKTILIAVMCLISQWNYAQYSFVKQWDYRYGGADGELLYHIQNTKDSGLILNGISNSGLSGDKTQNSWGDSDYWIVKLNSAGIKQWDKRYGGTGHEGFNSLLQTSDAGYLLGGNASPNNTGDQTQFTRGQGDFWIVKIDSLGNKLWDKRYGGSSNEYLYSLLQTTHGGFLLGGLSNSGISGDKTQENWDNSHFNDDGWVVMVDSSGNKLWDRRYGGIEEDGIYKVLSTQDKGYILGCASSSDSSGDKTQHTRGYSDYWIVKIDSTGNVQWDKRYGGSGTDYFNALTIAKDGGYLICGTSASENDGDKSEDRLNSFDYWIVKIDTVGNKIWDRTFGGYDADELESAVSTADNGYLISGSSQSNAGADKSEDNIGTAQTWVVKLDSMGNKQWDKTIFTLRPCDYSYTIQTNDGCYLAANSNSSGIGGYKSQNSWNGFSDYWVIKFCMEPYNSIMPVKEGESFGLSVYPNPFATDVAISVQRENLREASFTISNSLGQIIYQRAENNLSQGYTKMLDLRYLPNGLYFITVEADGERVVRRVVKE